MVAVGARVARFSLDEEEEGEMANTVQRIDEIRPPAHPVTSETERGARRLLVGAVGALLLVQGARWLRSTTRRRAVARARTVDGGRLGRAAGELGRGLAAGLAGTAAITAVSTVEQLVKGSVRARRRGEEPSFDLLEAATGPWLFAADAAGKLLGVTPRDDHAKRRFSVAVHWTYGAAWGASLAAMGLAGIRGPLAAGALLAGVLGAEMVAMPALHFFPPPSQWGKAAIVSSTYQHAVYAAAAALAFRHLRG